MFKSFFQTFQKDESGMVTVDWVVLSAGVLIGVSALINPVKDGITETGDDIAYVLSVGAEQSEEFQGGNPGNNKGNGNAGENPNGKGGWGDGDKGKSK